VEWESVAASCDARRSAAGEVGGLAEASPGGSVFQVPVDESELEADIESCLFGFDPFMAEDFFSFGEEFPIQGGVIERETAGGTIHVE
jgi:hypothetical protein